MHPHLPTISYQIDARLKGNIWPLSRVDVWRIDASSLVDGSVRSMKTLDRDELSTLSGLKFPDLKTKYISAHVSVRIILASYLGCDPGGIRFARGRRGKPFISYPTDTRLYFNMSRSGASVLVAVSNGMIGADAERCAGAPLEIAPDIFNSNELEKLNASGSAEIECAFTALWTVKESYLKLSGSGLGVDLTKVRTRNVRSSFWEVEGPPDICGSPATAYQFAMDKNCSAAISWYGQVAEICVYPMLSASALVDVA
ncbi:4'-phosphopantetheinyl transferase family protein [Notoacmeibacter marinus]|uniref:4'-phosphopantetheinyl transferase family protein n=1 Tax=Notoacmeibacter marinus TaxID=1876515 RepID=UPI000DF29454|nr:4'-phosphopantetheinyl transferase superfamily protein [Notoacmeibacter marinus]